MADAPGGMGHTVQVDITGNAEGLRNAVREATQHVVGLRSRFAQLGQGGANLLQTFRSMGSALSGFAAMAGLGTVVAQMYEIKNVGQQFTNQMEQTLLGLKAIYAQQINVYDAQWNQVSLGEKMLVSQRLIAEQIEKIKTDALVTTATLSQITGMFQMALPVALQLGMSLDQTRGFVVTMVKTAGAMGIPMEHLNMEIRDALQGHVQMEDRMLRSLGLTTEMLQRWKAQGPEVLVANLQKKMEAFEAASQEAGNTWQGLTSTMDDFKQQLAGMVMAPAIEVMRKALIAIRDSLGEVQNGIFVFNERVMTVVSWLQWAFEETTKLAVALGETLVQLFEFGAMVDQVTGGLAKWVVLGYTVLSVFKSILAVGRAIAATKWGMGALALIQNLNPVMLWATGALVGLTAVMTLWNRMKGDVAKDIGEIDDQIKELRGEIDKSKQRGAALQAERDRVADANAPERLGGDRGEGMRKINDMEVLEALKVQDDDEKKWVEEWTARLSPMQARYKSIEALFDKKEFSKQSMLKAIDEAQAEEVEVQQKTIANARVVLLGKQQRAEQEKQEAEEEIAAAERQKKIGLMDETDVTGERDARYRQQALDREIAARKKRKAALDILEKLPEERRGLDAQANVMAVPNEQPQQRALRLRREAIEREVDLMGTLMGWERQLVKVDQEKKIAATGYYLTIHKLQAQELKDTEGMLALKVAAHQMTQEQADKEMARKKEQMALDLKANLQAVLMGKMALKDVPVVVKRQSFMERQASEVSYLSAKIMQEIGDASGAVTKLEADIEALKKLGDPTKMVELPKKEKELEKAREKYENVNTGGQIQLLEMRRKQQQEQKAEEERVLQHRIAMGKATEQDEVARLTRLANSEEETEADRDKYRQQARDKQKAEEERLLQFKIATGQASEADELDRLARIAKNETESLANRQKAITEYREKFKAEEERLLQHRKAMGQATEQQELERLYRIANDPNESLANRMKAEEQHFAKFKSLEQQLFDYRKGMGLISMELEISRLRAIAGAANRTAEERMAAEQKVYDLEKALIEKRRSGAKNLVKMGQEYLKEKYGEREANRGRSQADWARVADEAIYEKERKLQTLKNSGIKTPEQMQQMYDLDKELSDLRTARKEIGDTREQMEGGTVPTPEMDRFRRVSFERDQLLQKKNRTPEDEAQLVELQKQVPEAHKAARLEAQGETKTQREAAAGTSPASPAFAGVAKALGLDTLPGQANKAFEQVATSYQELLTKMEAQAAVAGAKINTLLYEGFLGRLKQDLSDEVSRS